MPQRRAGSIAKFSTRRTLRSMGDHPSAAYSTAKWIRKANCSCKIFKPRTDWLLQSCDDCSFGAPRRIEAQTRGKEARPRSAWYRRLTAMLPAVHFHGGKHERGIFARIGDHFLRRARRFATGRNNAAHFLVAALPVLPSDAADRGAACPARRRSAADRRR